MRCLGRTQSLRRCRREQAFLVCHQHRFQPLILVVSLISVIGACVGLLVDGSEVLRRISGESPNVVAGSPSDPPVNTGVAAIRPPSAGKESSEAKAVIERPFNLQTIIDSGHMVAISTITDTAMLAFLDPDTVEHRRRDSEDWWTEETEMLREMNWGNAIFVTLGADDMYEVLIHGGQPEFDGPEEVRARLVCKGGFIYVGGYVDDGVFPENNPFGGEYLDCPAGVYDLTLRRFRNTIDVTVRPLKDWVGNEFKAIPYL